MIFYNDKAQLLIGQTTILGCSASIFVELAFKPPGDSISQSVPAGQPEAAASSGLAEQDCSAKQPGPGGEAGSHGPGSFQDCLSPPESAGHQDDQGRLAAPVKDFLHGRVKITQDRCGNTNIILSADVESEATVQAKGQLLRFLFGHDMVSILSYIFYNPLASPEEVGQKLGLSFWVVNRKLSIALKHFRAANKNQLIFRLKSKTEYLPELTELNWIENSVLRFFSQGFNETDSAIFVGMTMSGLKAARRRICSRLGVLNLKQAMLLALERAGQLRDFSELFEGCFTPSRRSGAAQPTSPDRNSGQ
ncbi:MAG: hypothetical protein LBT47_00655 [Deltaproteobacteria bacterium]|jgi:hypothetical protein|nr:hypothetical protein [Deltaproteobacteria bacterium]